MMDPPHGAGGPGAFIRDRLTVLTYGMAIAFGLAVAALGPAMPLLREDLGISRTVGGLHFTAIAAGSVLAGFAVERLTRAWGRRRVFWWGGAGVALGSMLIAVGWHPAVTLAGGLIVGAAGASALTTCQATLSDHHPLHRSVALTEVATAMSVGTVLPALLIGASVAAGAGWRLAFLAPLAVWIALGWRRHSVTFPNAEQLAGRPQRRPLPHAYWFYWAAFIPAVGAEWSVGAWGAGYLVDVAGVAEGSASFLMATFFGAIAAGRFVGGRVARTVSAFPLLLGATAVGLGGILLFWGSRSVFPVVAGLLIVGLGISMLFPMLLSLAMETAPDRADIASARVFIAAGGATLVAPFVLGAIADQVGIRAAFAIVPGLFFLVAPLAALGRRADAAARRSVSTPSG